MKAKPIEDIKFNKRNIIGRNGQEVTQVTIYYKDEYWNQEVFTTVKVMKAWVESQIRILRK